MPSVNGELLIGFAITSNNNNACCLTRFDPLLLSYVWVSAKSLLAEAQEAQLNPKMVVPKGIASEQPDGNLPKL
jgi:hypothetical protein